MMEKIYYFFENSIWEEKHPLWQEPLIWIARLIYLFIHGMTKNKLTIRATALAYTTLLSIVPVIAVMLSFFKAFGGMSKIEAQIRPFILNNLSTGSGEIVQKYLLTFTEKLHAGTLGLVSFALLLLTVFGLLSTIEGAFNDIGGVEKGRALIHRFNAYWTLMTIGPLFMAFSVGVTSSLHAYSYPIQMFLKVLPTLLTWILFTMLYAFIPNTHVRFRSAFLGGVLAGSGWQFAKYAYTIYVAKADTYSTIYGSLAALPIFLVWLYVTWLIVLMGAEISFADQNIKTYREKRSSAS